MLLSRILCRVTPHQLTTSRFIVSTISRRSELKTPVQEWGWAYLQRQKALGRPIAPHLTIYQPQLTWMGVGFAVLPFNFTQFVEYIRSWHIPAVITSAFKFVVAFPIIFHTLNGIRFIGFDLAKGVDNIKAIYKSGYLVLALSTIIATIVVINAWPSKQYSATKKY